MMQNERCKLINAKNLLERLLDFDANIIKLDFRYFHLKITKHCHSERSEESGLNAGPFAFGSE
ncbi:MAG: hypothetical protein CV087_12870 [Candidatus Brocadia sp. WS118]|nr:MAG: hypothetical protein CV087_12870 [Candidatus Brocadia sp. WS118]